MNGLKTTLSVSVLAACIAAVSFADAQAVSATGAERWTSRQVKGVSRHLTPRHHKKRRVRRHKKVSTTTVNGNAGSGNGATTQSGSSGNKNSSDNNQNNSNHSTQTN